MSEPLPRIKAYEDMGLGLFVHWGLYSQLAAGEWTELIHERPKAEYERLIETFDARDFDADDLVAAAKEMGAGYITLTTKHHEGFFLYDTQGLSTFDAPHSAARRDLVAEFADACHRGGIKPFFYMATYDWHSPLYETDFDAYLEYLRKSVEILCRNYGEVGGFWFDGNWNKKEADWKLPELYGTIRNWQPDAIIINNTGLKNRGKIVDPEIDVTTYERHIAGEVNHGEPDGKYVAGEVSVTTNKHWGIAAGDLDYKSPRELIETIANARRAGANALVNIGPTAGGAIQPIQRNYLRLIGMWMRMAGTSVHTARPSATLVANGGIRDFALDDHDADGSDVSYLFVHDLAIVGNDNVTLGGEGSNLRSFTGATRPVAAISWLDNDQQVPFMQDVERGILTVDANGFAYGTDWVIRVARVTYR